jgi:uncharacterized membrane protein HdeD (DUF308 family)
VRLKPWVTIVIGVLMFILGTVMMFDPGFIHRVMTQ